MSALKNAWTKGLSLYASEINLITIEAPTTKGNEMDNIETTINAESGACVFVDAWDDGVWLKIGVSGGGSYTPLTRTEAEQLLAGLQAILNKEVAA